MASGLSGITSGPRQAKVGGTQTTLAPRHWAYRPHFTDASQLHTSVFATVGKTASCGRDWTIVGVVQGLNRGCRCSPVGCARSAAVMRPVYRRAHGVGGGRGCRGRTCRLPGAAGDRRVSCSGESWSAAELSVVDVAVRAVVGGNDGARRTRARVVRHRRGGVPRARETQLAEPPVDRGRGALAFGRGDLVVHSCGLLPAATLRPGRRRVGVGSRGGSVRVPVQGMHQAVVSAPGHRPYESGSPCGAWLSLGVRPEVQPARPHGPVDEARVWRAAVVSARGRLLRRGWRYADDGGVSSRRGQVNGGRHGVPGGHRRASRPSGGIARSLAVIRGGAALLAHGAVHVLLRPTSIPSRPSSREAPVGRRLATRAQ